MNETEELAVILVCIENIDHACASAGHVPTSLALDDFRIRLGEFSGRGAATVQLSNRKFVLLLRRFRNRGHVHLAAQKVERLIKESSKCLPDNLELDVKMGIAILAGEQRDAQDILRHAEIALRDARGQHRSVSFYEEKAADRFISERNLERKLGSALENGDLELHYQPKIHLGTKEVVGAEALMRWHDEELGDVSPEVFIKAAERCGLITELTYLAMQHACRELNKWKETAPRLTVAVNTTPSAMRDHNIVDVLEIATSIWDVEPDRIILEVTEEALMVDPTTSHAVLTAVSDLGARVSIDDFGTGYSSLAYLRDLPADELKIDRSFVMNMLTEPRDYKIVEHTTSLGKAFGLDVVAEGVQSLEMMKALWSLGCDLAQGYVISRPLPAGIFLEWYSRHNGRWEHDG
ncbi:MAG: GGDEF domain-containing phosphodiesterase [Arenicellales bacterium]